MRSSPLGRVSTSLGASYLDELSLFKGAAEKKCLVGFSTDSWNIGQRKYKDFLAVHKMYKRVQKVDKCSLLFRFSSRFSPASACC